ncbi:type II toxin-antitoxin system HicB family antitoxin [Candidatus Pacearchaeota archaeon]|nr:type II toxin-antitoxin system HicB family antitoxin [Candidatus Pacearchaeota archaeon]
MDSFTAIIRKGEKQYVALCPEVDVVSQGFTIEEAVNNLKEAVELYLEEIGMPENNNSEVFLVKFEVKNGKTAEIIR